MSSVVLLDFVVELLRYNSVAILNHVGSLTMASEALLAASKMGQSRNQCRFDEEFGDDGRECECRMQTV